MLKKILINGLRGFGEAEEIQFSLPNGKYGSGLNIIVGPNNSGKTTITEAVRLYNCQADWISFSEGKRNAKNNSHVQIKYWDENNKFCEINTTKTNGSQVDVFGDIDHDSIPYVISSRRTVDYSMHSLSYLPNMQRTDYSRMVVQNSKSRLPNWNSYEQRIFTWFNEKDTFDELLKQIITEPFDWTIDQNEEGAYYIKIVFENQSIVHTREGMGDGFWSVFTIVDALYDAKKDSIVVIDEPELSLHPSFQKKVERVLGKYAENRQIIIATHSPYFISLDAIINGASLIRTYKDKNGNIKIGMLQQDDRIFINSAIKNVNNPHLWGLESRELFFAEDNIIITEGQEDVVIISNVCKQLGIELNAQFFGWGAGGAENISKVLALLKHLKYKKVTAIFDGDKKTKYQECIDNYPEYRIEILSQDDIRDKPAVTARPEKNGITNSSGKIKEEHIEEFKNLISRINHYHEG